MSINGETLQRPGTLEPVFAAIVNETEWFENWDYGSNIWTNLRCFGHDTIGYFRNDIVDLISEKRQYRRTRRNRLRYRQPRF